MQYGALPVRMLAKVCSQFLGVVLSFSAVSAFAQPTSQIRIGTGGPAGVYFVAGNAICRMVRIDNRSGGFGRLRRQLEGLLPDDLFAARLGITDSELLFLLF